LLFFLSGDCVQKRNPWKALNKIIMFSPLVSVVIPCFNAIDFLDEAVESIVNQTYSNLEIILINDGSTDETALHLDNWSKKDPRIKVIHNDGNLKLIKTLNIGIGLANGEYIARMDADDIALPDRISKQVKYMELHSDIDVCSTYCRYIQPDGKIYSKNTHFSCSHYWAIRFMGMFESPLLHPGVLGKRSVLKNNPYAEDPTAAHIEDYELWTRLLREGFSLGVLPEFLMHYRRNPGSVSFKNRAEQNNNHLLCSRKQIEIELPEIVIAPSAFNAITTRQLSFSFRDLKDAVNVLEEAKMFFLGKYNISSGDGLMEIESWVKQRELRMMGVYFFNGGLKVKILVLFHLFKKPRRFLSYKTIENICSRCRGFAIDFIYKLSGKN